MAKLYFYYAAMNAGKSTTLLQSAHNYEERGLEVLLFTPKLDDRYGVGKITSRIGLEREAQIFDRNTDLLTEVFKVHQNKDLDCILVDEAQFCTQTQVLQLTLICDKLDIPVLAYGLRTDFQGEPLKDRYLQPRPKSLWRSRLSARVAKNDHECAARCRRKPNVEGAQVDIGHHTSNVATRVRTERVTPVDYGIPQSIQDA